MTNNLGEVAGGPPIGRGPRLSRTFVGGEGGPSAPNAAEASRRPSNSRTVSDNEISTTARTSAASDNRASGSSSRMSTFGSLFRSRPDTRPAMPSHSQSQTSNSPVAAPTSPFGHLPPPLPNPYDTHVRPVTPPHSANFSAQTMARPPDRPYVSAPSHQTAFVPEGYPNAPMSQQQHHYRPPPLSAQPYPAYTGVPGSPVGQAPYQQSLQRPPPPNMHTSAPQMPQNASYTGQHTQGPVQQQRHENDSDDLEAVLAASRASAAEESRKREEEKLAEEAHYLSLHESEQAARRRKEEEEEERMLLEVMEASEREEREAQARRQEKEREEEMRAQLLLEESRQSAIREDEERVRRQHADLLAQSKLEADLDERKRRREKEEQILMEEAAMRESVRQMEEEWRRREEEERAVAAFMQHGGQLGAASYWQHLDQKKAYDLAVKMDDKATKQVLTTSVAGPSRRRPLPMPPTPEQAALAAGVEPRKQTEKAMSRVAEGDEEDEVWMQSDDELMHASDQHVEEEDGKDPFGDDAEAPPTYDEVRTDRPPDAPTSIPSHIQFAQLPVASPTEDNNTVVFAPNLPEKSAAHSLVAQQQVMTNTTSTSSAASSNSTPQSDPARQASGSSARRHAPLPVPPHDDTTSVEARTYHRTSVPPHAEVEAVEVEVASPSLAPPENSERGEVSPDRRSSAALSEAQTEFQQRRMKGTDFGYCQEPFGTSLYLRDDADKGHFPMMISLDKANVNGALREQYCFFIIRAPSWKALLRALAWYGNTRIEAGPEDVVDHPDGVPLRVEVEFVTPSKVDISAGLRNAYVGVCFSLALPSLADASSSALMQSLKNASRGLDSSYMRQGAARRVIALPSQAPKLPLDVVRLAQHMHRAHRFSAACPSTGSSALHSPRDLHHAVERHDVGFVAKMQRRRRDQIQAEAAGGSNANGSAGGWGALGGSLTSPTTAMASSSLDPEVRRARRTSAMSRLSGLGESAQSGSGAHSNGIANGGGGGGVGGGGGGGKNSIREESGTGFRNDQEDFDGGNDDESVDDLDDELDAGAVELADGTDQESSRMRRMKARVRRRLAKRSGDPRTVDEDLESWITPYDVTQHG